MSDFKWYVLKTKTNCESKAKLVIEKVINRQKMENQIEDILIPERDVVQIVKGKKVTRSKKIYPGYVFLKMKLNDELWHAIKSAANVSHFVGGTRAKPREVPESQLKTIKQQITEGVENPQTQVDFMEGDHVAVISGPFKGFKATIQEVNHEKERVRVSVGIFGRMTPVELSFLQIHKKNFADGED